MRHHASPSKNRGRKRVSLALGLGLVTGACAEGGAMRDGALLDGASSAADAAQDGPPESALPDAPAALAEVAGEAMTSADARTGDDARQGAADAVIDAAIDSRPENARIVFVTSTRYGGALGGPSGADAHCRTRAQAGGLSGTYKAWLSTATDSAASRLVHHDGPYVRPDGAVVATSWADLTDGTLAVPILIDERGNPLAVDAWTGTEPSGEPYAGQDCSGFTSDSFAQTGLCGASTAADGRWTRNITPACGTALSLYCVEQ